MPTRIRPAAARDLDALQGIEDRADRILVELLRPAEWWPAPTGAERAAEPGFLLVAEDGDTEAHDGQLVGFAHVLEVDGLAHLEQVAVPRSRRRRRSTGASWTRRPGSGSTGSGGGSRWGGRWTEAARARRPCADPRRPPRWTHVVEMSTGSRSAPIPPRPADPARRASTTRHP